MNLEDNKIMCIVSYITQSSTKCDIAQKALENRSQAFSSSEMTVKPGNSENLLANNNSNSHRKPISAKPLSDTESDISVIYSLKAIKKASCKCK